MAPPCRADFPGLQVQVEPGIVKEQGAQAVDRIRGRDLHGVVVRGVTIVLLKGNKEKRLVLAYRAAGSQTENIVAEHGLRNTRKPVEVGNRVEPLRLVSPQQCAMEIVGSRFGHEVKDAPTRPNSTLKLPV